MSLEKIQNLNQTLKGLKLDAECVRVSQHRHFAFYDLSLGTNCRVSQISARTNELALNLRSLSNPIVKLLRDQGLVRLQVVEKPMDTLKFSELRAKYSNLPGVMPFLLGESDEGKPVIIDQAKSDAHLLVAGATGSGKSVLLHNIIANAILLGNVQIYLVDPKQSEFSTYANEKFSGVVDQVVHEYDQTLEMLEHLITTMNLRYSLLKRMNMLSVEQDPTLFDRIVVIIDEVNELVMKDGKEKKFERAVISLAQKSRAAGIHLILATQRPSIRVLSGDLKNNFSRRICARVSSRVDSQVVLDSPGGEALLGKGDALLNDTEHYLTRFQVGYVTPFEIGEMMDA